MPVILNDAKTLKLDKLKITRFEVQPESGIVIIHYSKGYENEDGQFIEIEFSRVEFQDVTFDPNLYESVKTTLYQMLIQNLNLSATMN